MVLLESKHAEAFSSTVMETQLADLSKRELEVARQLAAGSSSKQVAEKLGLSPNTVAEFTRRVYKKLGAKNRAELVLKMRGMS
jgi:DNA-binding CsgD family transcriptional regulator